MGDSAYKGVSASQDSRFTNKDITLLRKLTFPPHFSTKVDMKKVELSVIKPWISRRITELLGFEDDVVLEYAAGMLEEERFPDPKKVQIQLTGFLEGKTAEFMSELWELLVSAQESPGGVPKRFVEEKKEELRRKREEGERVVREARERAIKAAEGEGRKRSRWDQGAPSNSTGDGRSQAYGREGYRRDERRGERSRDSGWGARAPPPPPPRNGDSWRPARRSPSPPPRRRRSPSPLPKSSLRDGSKEQERERERSVTPDYRDRMPARSSKARKEEKRDTDSRTEDLRERINAHHSAGKKEETRGGPQGKPFRDMDFPDTDSEDSHDDGETRKGRRDDEGDSSMSSDDGEYAPPSDDENHTQSREVRERDLRSKLLAAKASRRS